MLLSIIILISPLKGLITSQYRPNFIFARYPRQETLVSVDKTIPPPGFSSNRKLAATLQ